MTDLDSCTDPDPHCFIVGSRLDTVVYHLPYAYIKDPTQFIFYKSNASESNDYLFYCLFCGASSVLVVCAIICYLTCVIECQIHVCVPESNLEGNRIIESCMSKELASISPTTPLDMCLERTTCVCG